jgi:hypothetical protein
MQDVLHDIHWRPSYLDRDLIALRPRLTTSMRFSVCVWSIESIVDPGDASIEADGRMFDQRRPMVPAATGVGASATRLRRIAWHAQERYRADGNVSRPGTFP